LLSMPGYWRYRRPNPDDPFSRCLLLSRCLLPWNQRLRLSEMPPHDSPVRASRAAQWI